MLIINIHNRNLTRSPPLSRALLLSLFIVSACSANTTSLQAGVEQVPDYSRPGNLVTYPSPPDTQSQKEKVDDYLAQANQALVDMGERIALEHKGCTGVHFIVVGTSDVYANDKTAKGLEQKAPAGDSQSTHYLDSHVVTDDDEAIRCLEVEAQRGDAYARYQLGATLVGMTPIYKVTPESCARGRELLESDREGPGAEGSTELLAHLTDDCQVIKGSAR